MANNDEFYFHEDIILKNILVRVPRKSRLLFRCVSKHWNQLILDLNSNDSRSCKKIFLPGRFCQVIDKRVTGGYSMVTADSPFQGKIVSVGGTFNGIVLLALKNPKSPCKVDMMLYNPLTRVYNKVPELPPNSASSRYTVSAFGFGHGATQDDLKIVTLGGVYSNVEHNAQHLLSLARSRSFFPRESDPRPALGFSCMEEVLVLYMNVFSLKNKSWNTLTAAEPYMTYSEFSTSTGTFVNGFLYWIISRNTVVPNNEYTLLPTLETLKKKTIYTNKSILALDVKKMMFSEIKFQDDDDNIAFDVLGTIKGRLCWITCNKRNPGDYKLSVINKQGLWETHSKSCLRPLLWHDPDYQKHFHAMCIFDEGKIIMINKKTKKLIIGDLLNDYYKHDVNGFESLDDSEVWKRQAIEYEPTLVSPSDLCSSSI